MAGNPTSVIIISSFILIITVSILTAIYRIRNLRLRRAQELLRTEIEIHEQSFQNISHEIHDNIGQLLSLAKLNLNAVETGLPEEKSEKIRNSKDLVGKAIADLRTLSKNLNAVVINEIGLTEAIKKDLATLSRTGRYETVFTVDGNAFSLGSYRELIIFRIFQQMINKSISQNGVKVLKVKAIYAPGKFRLAVWDDSRRGTKKSPSKSIDQEQPADKNMFTRATLIGAELSVYSNIEKGSTTIFSLDLSNNN